MSTPKSKAKARERAKKHRGKEGYKEKHATYANKPGAKLTRFRGSAMRKGLAFELTLDTLLTAFWQKPCHYCGDPIETVGIDRVDSSKGYVPGNMVPCCSMCNFMKLTSSREDFIAKCKQVTKYRKD